MNKTSYKIRNNQSIFQKDKNFTKIKNNNFREKRKKLNSIPKLNSLERKYNNDKKRNLDFSKMSKRNFEIIINNSTLNNPSFYKYEPKFNYITQ